MVDVRIILSGVWVATMLTYLLGDVLRIFSGDFKVGHMGSAQASQAMYLGAAVMLLIPIVMVILSLIVAYPAIRWITIVAAVIMFGFNLVGLPGYPAAYDKFLIVVSLAFNALTVWYAWRWEAA